jgi:integral membrane sensor domain MASE1
VKPVFAYPLLTVVYTLSGKLGLMLAVPPGYASPIFPAAGIAVTATLIRGRATLPWIFLGSLLLNLWAGYSIDPELGATCIAAAIIIAAASTLQAAIGGAICGAPSVIRHPSIMAATYRAFCCSPRSAA